MLCNHAFVQAVTIVLQVDCSLFYVHELWASEWAIVNRNFYMVSVHFVCITLSLTHYTYLEMSFYSSLRIHDVIFIANIWNRQVIQMEHTLILP